MKKIYNITTLLILLGHLPLFFYFTTYFEGTEQSVIQEEKVVSMGMDYYWVGGTGMWSDYGNHWATSSNGTAFHNQVPTSMDNVYFDANSFTAANQTVTVDESIIYANNIDWTGVTNNPEITGDLDKMLFIYGSLTLVTGMNNTFEGEVHFKGNGTLNTIQSANQHFKGPVFFNGIGGGWTLQDALVCDSFMVHSQGVLTTNNQDVTVGFGFFSLEEGTRTMNLGSSIITITESWIIANNFDSRYNGIFTAPNLTINAGTSTIIIKDKDGGSGPAGFWGGGHTYANLTFSNTPTDYANYIINTNIAYKLTAQNELFIGGYEHFGAFDNSYHEVELLQNGHINGNNDFDILTFTKGKFYKIQNNAQQTINAGGHINAIGDCDEYITITSDLEGHSATFLHPAGTITTDYVAFQDIHASGGASFIANNGINITNNTGWSFPSYTSRTLYWVGGTGDWNDRNNWDLSSSGSGGQCIPTAFDKVVFTQNPNFNSGDIITLNTSIAFCEEMDWTGAPSDASLTGDYINHLYIYGDLTLTGNMNMASHGETHFKGHGANNNITCNGHSIAGPVFFSRSGGEWTFIDAFTTGKWVAHRNGTLNTNNQLVNIGESFLSYEDGPRTLNLGSSIVTIHGGWLMVTPSNQPFSFQPETPLLTVNAGTSTIIMEDALESFVGGGHDYFNVTFSSSIYTWENHVINTNILGKLTAQNKVHFNSFFPNYNNTFHEVELQKNADIYGNHSFDILTLTAGNVYQLGVNTSQTIGAGGQLNAIGNCDNFITLKSTLNGQHAILTSATGTINTTNLAVQDIVAAGGSNFTAVNGIDIANNVGWNFIPINPRTLYWVGNSGDWNDSSNWDLSSSGSGGQCIPTPFDKVIFTQNPNFNAGDIVNLNQPISFCEEMDWTGAPANTVLTDPFTDYFLQIQSQLFIYGPLTFSPNTDVQFDGATYFRSNGSNNNITTNGQHFPGPVFFDGIGGEWTFMDPFTTNQVMGHSHGILHTNNQAVNVGGSFYTFEEGVRTMNLGSSIFTVAGEWQVAPSFNQYNVYLTDAPNLTLNAGTSTIFMTNPNPMYGGGHNFYNITFPNSSLSNTNRLININTLGKVIAHNKLEINPYQLFDNTFKEVEFLEDGAINGNNIFETLTFTAAKTYTLQSNNTQTITANGNFNAVGTGSFPIEINSTQNGTQTIIHKDGAPICLDYLYLTDIKATGTGFSYVGANSDDVFNNDGWIFQACPPCVGNPPAAPTLNGSSITAVNNGQAATLILDNLPVNHEAVWFDATQTNEVYADVANSFQPTIPQATQFYGATRDLATGCLSDLLLVDIITLDNCITGVVQKNCGELIEGATVTMTGDVLATTQTDANGVYKFSNIPSGSNVAITPTKDTGCVGDTCINVLDVIAISQHILGISTLPSPYQHIAADINVSGTQTAFDMVLLRQFISGLTTSYPQNSCFRFVDPAYNFTTSNPSVENYPQSITISGIGGDTQADFIAVQIGNVTDCCEPLTTPFLEFAVGDLALSCNTSLPTTISVPVTVTNFNNVSGFQFSLNWLPSNLQYNGTSNYNLPDLNSGSFNHNAGELSVFWFDNTTLGQTIPDGTTIFTLELDVLSLTNSSIYFDDTPINQLVVNNLLETSLPITKDGQVNITGGASVNTGTYGPVCENDASIVLNGAPIPNAGELGIWSGTGVTDASSTDAIGIFDPTGLNGPITLTYTFTDVNGCTVGANTTIQVIPAPFANTGNYPDVCEDENPIILTGSPTPTNGASGNWSGLGVSDNSDGTGLFDPAGLSGTIILTYHYAGTDGCSAISTTSIQVFPPTTVNAGMDISLCSDDSPITLTGSPIPSTGTIGVWSGPGITNVNSTTGTATFDPTGISGIHTLTYTFTDVNGCTSSDDVLVTVDGASCSSCVGLTLSSHDVCQGDQVCLDITVNDFDDVASMQYSFSWDTTILKYEDIQGHNLSGLSSSSFNTSNVNLGILAMAWFDNANQGISLPDGTVLYQICFEALQNGMTTIDFTNIPTAIEFATTNALICSNLTSGQITVGNANCPTCDTTFINPQILYSENCVNYSISLYPTLPNSFCEEQLCFLERDDMMTGNGTNDTTATAAECIITCDSSIQTYHAVIHAGNSYQWKVEGGVILGADNLDEVTVEWGSLQPASVTLIETDINSCMDSTTICIEFIESPRANFTYSPIPACAETAINFTDLSVNADSYFWDFGDGNTSILENPTNTYSSGGIKTVTLIVSRDILLNFSQPYGECECKTVCSCTDTLRMDILVDVLPGAPILCVGTSCVGDTACYSTPIACPNANYAWTISANGTITDGGMPTDTFVCVEWTQGDIGQVELSVSGCTPDPYCPSPTIAKIPIIDPNFLTISGKDIVCQGAYEKYNTEKFNGATYNWEVMGGTLSASPPYGNSVDIKWDDNTPGKVIVHVQHIQKDCTASDTLDIDIRPDAEVVGQQKVCENDQTTYYIQSTAGYTGSFNWVVTGGTILSPLPTNFVTIDWNNGPGSYILTATPTDLTFYCNTSITYNVEVFGSPAIPTLATGPSLICPDGAYQYEATASPLEGDINWSITGGTASPTTGDQVLIDWNATGPYEIKLSQTSAKNPYCESAMSTTNILPIESISIIGHDSACTNSNSSFSLAISPLGTYPAGEEIEWTISPPHLGSVVNGQGSQNVDILWNNDALSATLTANYCGIALTTDTIVKLVEPNPTITDPGSVCIGSTAPLTFSGNYVHVSLTCIEYPSNSYNPSSLVNPTFQIEGDCCYQFFGLDLNGCQVKETICIPAMGPTADITALSTRKMCIDNGVTQPIDLLLGANTNGTGHTYQWQEDCGTGWTNTVTTNTLSKLGDTNPCSYRCIISDGTCSDTSNVIATYAAPCPSGGGGDPCQSYSLDFTNSECYNPYVFNEISTNVYNFTWEFGDGTFGTGPNPTHTYTEVGAYYVCIRGKVPTTPVGTDSCLVEECHIVNVPAMIDFDVQLSDCTTNPPTYKFNDLSTYSSKVTGVTYNWDFVDGCGGTPFSDTNANPTIQLCGACGSTVPVTLTITTIDDDMVSCSYPLTKNITLSGSTPSANVPIEACVGEKVNFTENSCGANEWLWEFGDGATSALQFSCRTYTAPGVYDVKLWTIDEFGCTSDTAHTKSITILPLPTVTIASSPTSPVCEGTTITLSATAGFSNYDWYDATNNSLVQSGASEIFTPTTTGFYNVQVTDADGCKQTSDDFEVIIYEFPAIDIEGDLEICQFENLELTAPPGYTYDWKLNGNPTNQTSATYTHPTLSTSSLLELTLTKTIGSLTCTKTISLPITVYSPPSTPTLSITPTNACAGDAVTVNITNYNAAFIYNWSNGMTGNPIVLPVAAPQNISVTVIDPTTGCSNTSSTETIHPLPDVCIVPIGCYNACDLDSICLPQNSAAYYQWLQDGQVLVGETDHCLYVSESGQYQVILGSIYGCTDTSDIVEFTIDACPSIDSSCVEIVEIIPKEIVCGSDSGCYYNPFCLPWLMDKMANCNNPYLSFQVSKAYYMDQPIIVINSTIASDPVTTTYFNCNGDTLQNCDAYRTGVNCNPSDNTIDIGANLTNLLPIWSCGDVIPPLPPDCDETVGSNYDYCIVVKNMGTQPITNLILDADIMGIPFGVDTVNYVLTPALPPMFMDTLPISVLTGGPALDDTAKIFLSALDTASGMSFLCDTVCIVLPECPQDTCCDETNNLILNGSFTGYPHGNIAVSSTPWTPSCRSPRINNGDGCDSLGCLQMWGNQLVGECTEQRNLNIQAGYTYRLNFCARYVNGGTQAPPWAQVQIRAGDALLTETGCSGTCEVVYTTDTLDTFDWRTFCFDWTPQNDYDRISIRVINDQNIDNGNFISRAFVDDVCMELIDSTCTPIVLCPSDTTFVLGLGETSIIYNYPPPIVLDSCEGIFIDYFPSSGSTFTCGTSLIECYIYDSLTMDWDTCRFNVIVDCSNTCQVDFDWALDPTCLKVNFDTTNIIAAAPVNFTWKFPDNATSTLTNPMWIAPDTGKYEVCLEMIDNNNCRDTICKEIYVQDLVPPSVICVDDIYETVAACDQGRNIFFNLPTASDNCGIDSVWCDYGSGDFFHCGTTVVTCYARDTYGNINACFFTININCECFEVFDAETSCGPTPTEYNWCIYAEKRNGAANTDCVIQVNTQVAGVVLNQTSETWIHPDTVKIIGTLTTTRPIPTDVLVTVDFSCTCPAPDGHITSDCSPTYVLHPPCCDSITVDGQEVCGQDANLYVALNGSIDFTNVSQTIWYVAPAPCGPTPFGGTPYQISSGYADLLLLPNYLTSDVCIYAEVIMAQGPCKVLTSNVDTVEVCQPVTCSIPDQDTCYVGSPITPQPLELTIVQNNQDCDYTVQWFDPTGTPINGATGLMYQPPAIDFLGAPDDCSYSVTYTAAITSVCGTYHCTSTITLDNDNAAVGQLSLTYPSYPMPFCPGQDATIVYNPACVGDPPMWYWHSSTDGITYAPIAGSGHQNPVYNTNRLFETTWFMVTKLNGSCTKEDTTILKIEIKDELSIAQFTATPKDACRTTGVDMSVDFNPCNTGTGNSCDCDYNIVWYKDGQVIHTGNYTSSPATLDYMDAALNGDYSGNYYAVVSDNCCGQIQKTAVVQIEEPMEVALLGPCFRCYDEIITLEGVVINPPVGNCTYQWFEIIHGTPTLITGGTNLTLDVDHAGIFVFEVTCGGCTQSASFDLKQCGATCACDLEIDNIVATDVSCSSATDGTITVTASCLSCIGNLEYSIDGTNFQSSNTFSNLVSGTYIVTVIDADEPCCIVTETVVITASTQSCDCPDDYLNVSNNPNPIPPDDYVANIDLISDALIANPDVVTFQAGNTITLTPGFTVEPGATFHAFIAPCVPTPFATEEDLKLAKILEDTPSIDTDISLGVQPNPFRHKTTLVVELNKTQEVSIRVFDQSGRMLKEILKTTPLPAGRHELQMTDELLYGGLYYISLQTAETHIMKKVIVISDRGFMKGDDDDDD